ncbi:hypothetical protein DB347_07950 [Opitutaceae bacterium EW11]|nr:hypothetical protein DB347_07950 [Opitutaceae bacterium EW11]
MPPVFARQARAWLLVAALGMLPVVVYWNTIWTHFGFRDDYSILREAHQEPGKVIGFCASQARPIYGWMLERSMARVDSIDQLAWLRLVSALCIGVAATLFWWCLVRFSGWKTWPAALAAGLLAVVPSSQVLTSWSICWPHSLAVVFGLIGFALSEAAWNSDRLGARLAFGTGAWLCLLVSALTYQSNGLFFLVLWGAVFLSKLEKPIAELRGWTVHHAGMLSTSFLAAYGFMLAAYHLGWFWESDRVAFEPDLVGKWVWFARDVLPNALALLAIDDIQGRTKPLYELAWVLSTGLLLLGGVLLGRRLGVVRMLLWFAAFLALGTATYGISIIASERWATYRTIYPLVGIVIVFLVASLAEIGRRWPRWGERVGLTALTALLVAGVFVARQQAYSLIAVPQQEELAVIENAVGQVDPCRPQRVFFITPTLRDAPAPLVYADEFGSLSTDSDWAAIEMLKDVLQAKSSGKADFGSKWNMVCGRHAPPALKGFDRFIDLRRIREFASGKHAKL